MKLILEKYFFKAVVVALILISFTTLIYKFSNQHLVGIGEFKYIDWSINIFNEQAVLSYYRPFFYIITNFLSNIFGLNIFLLKSINLILFLANIFLIIKISEKYLGTNNFYLIPLIFFLFNPTLLDRYSILGVFSFTHFFILTNVFIISLIIEKNKKNYFILLGIVNAFGSLCREELVFIFLINLIFIIFFLEKKKMIIYYLVSFLFIHLTFFIYFFDKINFSKFISVGLNVVDREINYSIREYYYNLDSGIDIAYKEIFNFFEKFEKQFSNFFLIKQILLFSIFYQFYLNKKKKLKNSLKSNYLFFLIITFLIFYFFIRASDRLFIYYEVLFIILLLTQLLNFKFKKKIYYNFILIFILILSFSKIYINYKENKFEPRFSINNLFYNKILKDYNNQRILISPSSRSLIHKPERYFDDKPSENYSLTSKIYFDDKALLFNDLIGFIQKDNEINNIKDLNIKYFIVEVNSKSNELLFPKDKINIVSKILKFDISNKKDLKEYSNKQSMNLRLYGGNIDEYFSINEHLFNKLLLDNYEINKILKLENKLLKIVENYDSDGLYLIYFNQ